LNEPIVPAIRSNRWPKSWKKYFIELVYLRGYTMLYPNYPGFESLSTNHLEKGTHVKTDRVDEKKKLLFEVPLLDVDSSLVESLPDEGKLPNWDSLPVMDLWGAVTSTEELIERGWQTTRMIASCEELPDLLGQVKLRYDARELLCKKRWREEVDKGRDERLVVTKPLPKRRDVVLVPTEPRQEVVEEIERVLSRDEDGGRGGEEKRQEEKRDENRTRRGIKLVDSNREEEDDGGRDVPSVASTIPQPQQSVG
jgi:hypothetical protein